MVEAAAQAQGKGAVARGRRHPDATAAAYSSVIAKLPSEARQALKAA
jgi:hypothetical protein